MSTYERTRAGSALAVKIQSSDGTDAIAGTPATADWIDASFTPPPGGAVQTPDGSFTGSLDMLPPIIGGTSISIPFRMALRGSGTAAGAPAIARMLLMSSMAETATGSAIGAPTAATAGTTTTATLASPFAATADLYRGMPITLSGNPATAVTTMISNYTVGRVATFTRTFGSTLSTSTLGLIPINNRYSLTDTEADWKRGTVYVYHAGQLLIVLDAHVINPAIEMVPNQPAFLSGTIVGIVGTTWTETAMPAGAATAAASRVVPPTWRGGESQIGRAIARAASLTINLGTSAVLPENPENANGFDSPQITARAISASLVLHANSTATPSRYAAYQAGTDTVLSAMWGGTAGNRFGLVMPAARIVDCVLGERNGLATETVSLMPSAPNAGLFLASY